MATATVYRTTSSLPSARTVGWALLVFVALALVLGMAAILVVQNTRWVNAQLDAHKAPLQHPPEVMALMPLAPPTVEAKDNSQTNIAAQPGRKFRP